MKKSHIYKSMVALIALFVLGSCQSMFNDPLIKNNPNSPVDAGADRILRGAVVGMGELWEDTDNRIAMMWAGHLTGGGRQHLGFAQYIVTTTAFGWGNYYNTAAQTRLIQDKAAAVNNEKMVGVAQVLEALVISKVAELYGDIPYTQAFDIDQFPKPIYDKQSDVYASLLATLSTAITNLDLVSAASIDGDQLFGGDPALWSAAAHTLKARLYLHLKDYTNALAEAQLGISSPGGDMLFPHGESYTVDMNLNSVFFDINRPGDTSCEEPITPLPEIMRQHTIGGTDESRLMELYFQDGYYTSGLDPNTGGNTDYEPGDGFFRASAPTAVLTFFENQMILAEASQRLNLGSPDPVALAALNAVRAELSTEQIYGSTMPSRGTAYYPALTALDLTTDLETLQEVLTQKYILLYGSFEAWTDLRRAHVATPLVEVMNPWTSAAIYDSPIVNTPTGTIPNRYIYPQNQINTNPNVPKAAGGKVADQYQFLEIFQ